MIRPLVWEPPYAAGAALEKAKRLKNKRMKTKTEENLRDLWDNIKHTNILIIGVPEREEREKGPHKIFEEIITKIFPNMGKETLKWRKNREFHSK